MVGSPTPGQAHDWRSQCRRLGRRRRLFLQSRNDHPQGAIGNAESAALTELRLYQHFREALLAQPAFDAIKRATTIAQSAVDTGIGDPVLCQPLLHRPPPMGGKPLRLLEQPCLNVLGSDSVTDQSDFRKVGHHVLM